MITIDVHRTDSTVHLVLDPARGFPAPVLTEIEKRALSAEMRAWADLIDSEPAADFNGYRD